MMGVHKSNNVGYMSSSNADLLSVYNLKQPLGEFCK